MSVGPSFHSFVSQRLRLHYAEWGDRAAPPLLLVHGGRDHCRSWDWVAAELCQEWRVIAPDLRGHGDSAWSPDGDYTAHAFVYDLAHLIHHLGLAPLPIVAHSLGGNIAARYAGIYPEHVCRLVNIEGLGFSSKGPKPQPIDPRERWRTWIEERRAVAARQPRRYATLENAFARMKAANPFLSDARARHLTEHGVRQNEDGSFSWKFDPYLNVWPPQDLRREDIERVWAAISCPTLLCWGEKSWAANPAEDGRMAHFQDARLVMFEDAGHWLHHDQFDRFIAEVKAFVI